MCLKKRLGVYLKKFITVLCVSVLVLSLGICSVNASPASLRIDIFSPSAVSSGGGTVDVIIFAKETSDSDYGVPLYLDYYKIANDKMTGSSSLYQSSSVTSSYDIKLVYGLDFFGDYQFDPSATYTFFYYCSVTGLTFDQTGSNASISIGNLNFPSVATGKNSNNTRWFNFEGKFKGSDFLKSSSDNGYFSFTFTANNVKGNSGFSYYLSTFLTITDIETEADRILGGLNSTFGENYDQPDGSAQEDYENAESQLVGGVTSDLGGIENNWNDIGGFLGEYQGAFYGVGEFIGKVSSIPILKIILLFSISIGVFGLLLGVVSLASRNRGS